MFDDFGQQIYNSIIYEDRWKMYLDGLGITLVITVIAVGIGVVLGSIVAMTKYYATFNKKLKPLDIICDVYLTVIRGTPMVVQLLIMYFIVFYNWDIDAAPYIAALAFGVNSGAYVAEIVRSGILAVDKGQSEAGRSLGLTNNMTMHCIIFPQAIKNILPALGNEMIVLFKETAVVGFIAVTDLTMVGNLIRSRTFSPFVPLILVAIMYLAIVLLLTFFQRKLERRLARSDAR